MTTESERELRPLEVVWRGFEPILRSLAVAMLSGFVAGAIAGGVGSRIAMRIVAITAGDADQGAITDAEATVGEITAGGTIFLIMFGGFIGVLGGVAYLGARRWLADAGSWRGLAFGSLLLAMFGWVIIEGGNPDFERFGSRTLNIPMFAALFVLFGLLLPPLFDRVERGLPRPSLQWPGVGSLPAYGLAALFTLPMVGAIGSGFGEGDGTRRLFGTLLPAYALLALPVAAALLAHANGGFERLSELWERPLLLAAAVALLALPVIAGVTLDANAVRDIYEARG